MESRRTSTVAETAMIEFENIVFMDFQKAATTSIVAFMRSNLDEKKSRRKASVHMDLR
jgi:hypothetical protein